MDTLQQKILQNTFDSDSVLISFITENVIDYHQKPPYQFYPTTKPSKREAWC